ncbi:MAG: hypothetical protein GX590_02105 [Lentisphaerae bacterium]|nr:hypothetical protein [Lentisphaerota bacterium]
MNPCKADHLRGGLMPLWMLNDASTVAEKIAYLRRCAAGGIRSLTLHPRAGNLIPFASDEWFGMIDALVAEASRLDMKLWLYDEDPYPSGAAGGLVMAERPDLKARALVFKPAPANLRPGRLWFIDQRRVVWAGLVPRRGGMPARDLTAAVGPVRADWFSTEWDSRYYYSETPLFPCVRGGAVRMFQAMRVPEIPAGFRLAAIIEETPGTEGPWGSLPDLLNPETFGVFARLGLEPYDRAVGGHFGATVPGIFTDEAKPHGGTPFTGDLFESFRTRFGYELRTRLHQLFGDPLDDEAVRARLDYRLWIRDRFLDGFVRPYRAWCDAHALHLVGHFSPEDDPIQEAVCLPAVMPVMKTMGLPGCDVIVPAVGDAKAPTLNLGSLRVGSIKSQTGRRYGVSESQALGEWTIVSRKTRQIYAWQKVLGIDRFYTHGFYSSNDGVTNYEAPPDYGPNSSLFRGTGAVNAWLESCDAVMDGGVEAADVAVLDNVLPYWTWGPGMDTKALERDRRAWWLTILHALQAHVGIHALDADDAREGRVTPAGLVVGARTYTTVLVPRAALMDEAVFRKLQETAAAGVRVVWLGGGPARLAGPSGAPVKAPAPAGEVLRAAAPAAAWCRANLPVQVELRGTGRSDCFARRFRAADGRERLLVCNLAEAPRTLTLAGEAAQGWNPEDGLVDGDTRRVADGLRWEVPAMGNGCFVLGAPEEQPLWRPVRGGSRAVAFDRLGPNLLRLDACRITLKGREPLERPYPQPFWQCFDAYRTMERLGTFCGDLPVESTVDESDLRYEFVFESRAAVAGARLVLDPRCARGAFSVWHNGRRLTERLAFPREGIAPLSLPLAIRRGTNRLTFRFAARGAMDGLLANLRIEGDFAVTVADGRAVVAAAKTIAADPGGWLAMGLAHYMGDGVYRWSETFAAEELDGAAWALELDDVTDSARLVVNGVDQGTRAWAPWRWPLQGLRAGANMFELTVSSTAGNALSLRDPAQPQGWLGGSRLLRRCNGLRL